MTLAKGRRRLSMVSCVTSIVVSSDAVPSRVHLTGSEHRGDPGGSVSQLLRVLIVDDQPDVSASPAFERYGRRCHRLDREDDRIRRHCTLSKKR